MDSASGALVQAQLNDDKKTTFQQRPKRIRTVYADLLTTLLFGAVEISPRVLVVVAAYRFDGNETILIDPSTTKSISLLTNARIDYAPNSVTIPLDIGRLKRSKPKNLETRGTSINSFVSTVYIYIIGYTNIYIYAHPLRIVFIKNITGRNKDAPLPRRCGLEKRKYIHFIYARYIGRRVELFLNVYVWGRHNVPEVFGDRVYGCFARQHFVRSLYIAPCKSISPSRLYRSIYIYIYPTRFTYPGTTKGMAECTRHTERI